MEVLRPKCVLIQLLHGCCRDGAAQCALTSVKEKAVGENDIIWGFGRKVCVNVNMVTEVMRCDTNNARERIRSEQLWCLCSGSGCCVFPVNVGDFDCAVFAGWTGLPIKVVFLLCRCCVHLQQKGGAVRNAVPKRRVCYRLEPRNGAKQRGMWAARDSNPISSASTSSDLLLTHSFSLSCLSLLQLSRVVVAEEITF